jgi:serine/threonine protein kinase
MVPAREKFLSQTESFDDSHAITLGGAGPGISSRVLKVGQLIGGSYKLKSLLGRGGMGYVFCAEHIIIKHDYAVKILAPEMLNEASRRRFETEGRAIANLDHVNIVKVYNMGIDDGDCPFYVMDLLDGLALSDRIQTETGIDFFVCLDIFSQIASGLGYAHSKGIIHRDVKPSNIILLTKPDGRLQVKIVDFGIAKLTSGASIEIQSLTAAGEIFGSPYYMSPEQCLGDVVDVRSDIYSLGCTLFEALSGKPPFAGQNALDTMMMHQNKDVPRVLESQPAKNLPDAVDVLLGKMMAKRPGDRNQSMKQVIHDLERLQAGKPIGKTGAGSGYLPDTSVSDAGGDTRGKLRQGSDTVGNTDKHNSMIVVAALCLPLIVALGWWVHQASMFKAKAAPVGTVIGIGIEPTTGVSISTKTNTITTTDTNTGTSATQSVTVVPKSTFERIAIPDTIPGGIIGNNTDGLSRNDIEKASKAFQACPRIFSKSAVIAGVRRKVLHFPACPIGIVYDMRANAKDQLAQGVVDVSEDELLELKVKSSETAAIDLPEVFAKIDPCMFVSLSLSGHRPDNFSEQLPPGQSQADKLARILAIVSSWPHLKKISIGSFNLNEAAISRLDQLKALDRLEIHKSTWEAEGIGHRPFLDRLIELQLDKVFHTDQIIHCLPGSTKLAFLKLDELSISDASILELDNCPALQNLELSRIRFDDKLVKTLTQLRNLRHLRLKSPIVTAGQLRILAACHQIQTITVDGASLTADQREQYALLSQKIKFSR